MAEKTPSPIAMMLDHGSKYERLTYAFRHGYSSIMFDGSMLPMEENIRRTKEVVKLCHMHGMGVEGELGHRTVKQRRSACRSVYETGRCSLFCAEYEGDSLAVAPERRMVITKGYVPHINFEN
ncbi:MAG: class II fructose-bisphosphate aldolase [Christensenellales bacterium]